MPSSGVGQADQTFTSVHIKHWPKGDCHTWKARPEGELRLETNKTDIGYIPTLRYVIQPCPRRQILCPFNRHQGPIIINDTLDCMQYTRIVAH